MLRTVSAASAGGGAPKTILLTPQVIVRTPISPTYAKASMVSLGHTVKLVTAITMAVVDMVLIGCTDACFFGLA